MPKVNPACPVPVLDFFHAPDSAVCLRQRCGNLRLAFRNQKVLFAGDVAYFHRFHVTLHAA